MRLLCEFTQSELSFATGVPAYRISGAETGRMALNTSETYLLESFLRERWQSIAETESKSHRSDAALIVAGAPA
jgi:hypothetical protein